MNNPEDIEDGDEKKVEKCGCGAEFEFSAFCGADVCVACERHKGLARCFCGWAESGGDGYRELQEEGEVIEPEESFDEPDWGGES